MPVPSRLIASFEEQSLYHIICKSVAERLLFKTEENKRYFLSGYTKLLHDFVDTYAYCMMNNHVHWLIRTKKASDLLSFLTGMPVEDLTITQKKFIAGSCAYHELIEQQFNRFFISYSLAYNKENNVKGHLYNRPFKRIAIIDDAHFTSLIVYIHANPLKHGVMKDFREYRWSSYQSLISNQPTKIMREEVLEWFGGKSRFIETHKVMAEWYYDHNLCGE